ncbi:MAG: hypothetical protein TRG1_2804 [Flavobacteriaceae bacterium FS1-H7996/R]|nr:MAG: hypothetical protein TRG1_2804 [Flavobacteriaceae bacterium FS1-H7996/R]
MNSSKSASSVQILSHFRLKTKSQDEFNYHLLKKIKKYL